MLAVANLHAINFAPGSTGYHAQLEALGDALAAHRGPLVHSPEISTPERRPRRRSACARGAVVARVPVAFPVDARRRFFGRIFDWVYVRGVEVHRCDRVGGHVVRITTRSLVTFRIR